MICPNCTANLSEGMGAKGTVIDACAACGGVWLDKGEFEAYANEKRLAEKLNAATPSARRCPRCLQAMRAAVVGSTSLDFCDKCSGLWLDKGEFADLRKHLS